MIVSSVVSSVNTSSGTTIDIGTISGGTTIDIDTISGGTISGDNTSGCSIADTVRTGVRTLG